ncbi:MAG: hypothetical protein KDD11_21725 [Acidobacteria bacterium]|nr:hypothetical protein [Acidobacteriota bacterium]
MWIRRAGSEVLAGGDGRRPPRQRVRHRGAASGLAASRLLPWLLVLVAASSRLAAAQCQFQPDGPRACRDTIRVGDVTEAYLDVTANDGHEIGQAIYIVSAAACLDGLGQPVPGVTLTIVHDGPQADARGDLVRFRYQAPAPPPGQLAVPFYGCSFRYCVGDGTGSQACEEASISSIRPKGGLLAVDDVIPIDTSGSPNPGGAVILPAVRLLANDEPEGGVGILSATDGARGTVVLDASGEVSYQPTDPSFWTLGDDFEYTIAALDDPSQTDSATVLLEPVSLLAADDTVVVGRGVPSYLIPESRLLDNDVPTGPVRIVAVFDEQLPSGPFGDHVTWPYTGGVLLYSSSAPGGISGELGEVLGTFRYRIERTDGTPGTSEATVTVVVGEPEITARPDVLIARYEREPSGEITKPNKVSAAFAFLLANDEPREGIQVIDGFPGWYLPACGMTYLRPALWLFGGAPACQLSEEILLSDCTDCGDLNFWEQGIAWVSYRAALDPDPVTGAPGAEADSDLWLVSDNVPQDDVFEVAEGRSVAFALQPLPPGYPVSLTANDIGPLDLHVTGFPILPEHGSLAALGFQTATYRAEPGFTGVDWFNYEVKGRECEITPITRDHCPAGIGTVTIEVLPLVAHPDAVVLPYASRTNPVAVAALLADDGPPGQVEAAGFGQPLHGSLAVVDDDPATGVYAYFPGSPFQEAGVDRFDFDVRVAGGDPGLTRSAPVFLLREPQPESQLLATSFETGISNAWIVESQGVGSLGISTDGAVGGVQALAVEVAAGTLRQAVQDPNPTAEEGAGARFILDAGGLSLPAGEEQLLLAGSAGGEEVLALWLRGEAAGKSLRLEVSDALGQPHAVTATPVPISGGPHALSLEWWASPSAGSAAGGARVWLDGMAVGELSGLDNHAHRLSALRLGAVETAAGGAGELALDDYASWSLDRSCKAVIEEGFESNQLDGWAPWTTGSSHVRLRSVTPLDGQRDLETVLAGSNAAARHPVSTSGELFDVDTTFLLSPGTAVLDEDRGHFVFALRSTTGLVTWLRLRRHQGGWQLSGAVSLADGSAATTPWTAVDPGTSQVHVEWQGRAAAAGGGHLRLFLDGRPVGALTGLDNGHQGVVDLDLGVAGGANANSTGSIYFDEVTLCVAD